MTNEDNPAMNILSIMREQGRADNPIPFLIGEVISKCPFVVQSGALQLSREDLLIDKRFLKAHEEDCPITDQEDCVDIQTGETVILLVSEDKQTYVLLCTVR